MTQHAEASPNRFSLASIIKWALILVVVLPLLLMAIARMSVTLTVNSLEERARERGEPLTLAELAGFLPEVPDESNAALAILEIWADEEGPYWDEWRTNGQVVSSRNESTLDPALPVLEGGSKTLPWNESDVAAARAYVKSRLEHNARMKVALEHPGSRYPVRYTNGFIALLPHLAAIKDEIGGYHVEALLALHDQRDVQVVNTIDVMVDLTNTIKEEPFLISQLVHVACQTIAMNTVKAVLEHGSPDSALIARMIQQVRALDSPEGFRMSMLGERTGALSIFSMSGDEVAQMNGGTPQGGGLGNAAFGLLRFTGLMSADKRLMMETFEKVVQVSTNVTYAAAVEVQSVIDETATKARGFPPKILTSLLLPALGKAAHRFVKIETERELMIHALRIESARLENGGDVDAAINATEKLKPQFSGLKVRVDRSDTGFSLHATADDGTDFSRFINYQQKDE